MAWLQEKEVYLLSFVKEDTVQLRWAPASVELFMRGLNGGYSIKRTDAVSGQTKVFEIMSFKDRKTELLQATDSTTLFMTAFVAEYLKNSDNSDLEKQTPFFLLNLSASTNRSIAEVTGLYLEDLSAGSGMYSYSISFGDDNAVLSTVQVNADQLDENPPFTELEGMSQRDLKEAYLKWEAKSLGGSYGGYWLMRSDDGKDFYRLNETPLYYLTSQYEREKIHIDFVDSAVVEGNTYYYQVVPINHFGDLGEPSEVVEVYIQKQLNGFCKIDTVRTDGLVRFIDGGYQSTVREDEVVEFALYRSDKVNEGYRLIESTKAKSTNFSFAFSTDKLSGDRHYFKVAALSADKDTTWSYPYYHFSLDQEPPAMPTQLKGVIDSSGLARLSWVAPADNDIQGYRVFRANTLKEEFIEVTKYLSPDTEYVDTVRLDNLTPEMYYKVRAVDMNYNNSPLTEPILVMKPDTIPPVAPVFKSYQVKSNGVHLVWANSSSRDLIKQVLVRRSETKVDTLLNTLELPESFVDSSCVIGEKYDYQLLAIDRSNNLSKSESLRAVYEVGFRLAPEIILAKANRVDKHIELKWLTANNDPIYSVQVYRAINEGSFKLYKTLRENIDAYIDSELSPNNEYHYKIKVVYQSGKSSKLSEGVHVMY